MTTLEDAAIRVISQRLIDCTVEDVIYKIHFAAQIMAGLREGLRDVEEGKTITNDEYLKLFDRMLGGFDSAWKI